MTIKVSNFDLSTTEDQLTALFQQHGTVKAAEVARDVFTGQPRGFGFVEMADDAEAQNAMAQLHNAQWHERTLAVEETQTKTERKGSYPVGNAAQRGGSFQFGMRSTRRKGRR